MGELAELATERVRLRAWREGDLPAYAALNADPRVMEFFPAVMGEEESEASARRIMDQHERLGFTMWAVEVVASARGAADFVGFVGLSVPSFDVPFPHLAEPCVEIGWRLAADWWGLGIATEAATECLRYAFEDLDLPEVVSFAVTDNARSRAVMERIGMTYDCDFDHPRAAPTDFWRRHALYRATAPTPN
ncbi:MAG TPA: GNAT family N-acetyltransferase [Candidatus Nanopelagicales bacterium]|jgi:ribosomal-protein-alanine N-acetyltransferase